MAQKLKKLKNYQSSLGINGLGAVVAGMWRRERGVQRAVCCMCRCSTTGVPSYPQFERAVLQFIFAPLFLLKFSKKTKSIYRLGDLGPGHPPHRLDLFLLDHNVGGHCLRNAPQHELASPDHVEIGNRYVPKKKNEKHRYLFSFSRCQL